MLLKKITVTNENCKKDGTIKLSALQLMMQDCAGEDFDNYGTTGDEMRKNGMAFVITRISMDLFMDIRCGDKLEILTVHDHSEGVALIREYAIFSQNGYCCRATTVWIVLNLNTRRILRPSAIEHYPPNVNFFPTQVEYEKKVFAKDSIAECITDITVEKEHIDVNGHVNNTYYQDFLFTALNGICSDKFLSHVQISYLHEAFEGDVLKLYGLFGENEARIKALNGDNACFEAVVKFTEKNNG